MNRKTRRRIVLIVLLALLLAVLGAWYWNYRATKQLAFNFVAPAGDRVTAPTYFYAFSGTQANHLLQPIGVLATPDRIYVTDAKLGEVFVFTPEGQYLSRFGKGKLGTPLYMAKHPRTGNLYVSDRGSRQVAIFTPEGKYVGKFDPKLPKDQLPKFDAKGNQWIPIALAFAPDGKLFVTDILNGHRLLVFGADGKFQKSVGTAGLALKVDSAATAFQFPNSVKVLDKEVWVVDSNNRRIQIFDLNGKFTRIIPTAGLPRGMAFLPPRKSTSGTATVEDAVVVDTLAHDATIWSTKGENLVNFGTQGSRDGEFSFPTDVSVGSKSLIFITDTNNIRVQVWGWPEKVSFIPQIQLPQYWAWCLTPLLLLPLLLFLRKRKFVANGDFIDEMIAAEKVSVMPGRRRQWLVSESDYERFKDVTAEGVSLAQLLVASEYSESDARALMDRYEIDHEMAALLAMAQRAKLFCCEDLELRRLAKLVDIDTVDRRGFLERFDKLSPSVEK